MEITLLSKTGEVEFSMDNGTSWSVFRTLDTVMSKGSRIRTGKDSYASIEFPEGSVLDIQPSSTVGSDVVRHKGKNTIEMELSLLSGEYLGHFKKKNEHENISLHASGLSIMIRGTTVRVGRDGKISTLAVTEGLTSTKVPKGPEQAVAKGKGLRAEEKNLVNEGPNVTLEWNTDKDVLSRFELAKDREFAETIDQQEGMLNQHVVKVPRGEYFWRVVTGRKGVYGYTSPVQQLVIAKNLNLVIRPEKPMRGFGAAMASAPGNKLNIVAAKEDNDIASMEYSWDGETFVPVSGPVIVPATEGSHTIQTRAVTEGGARGPVLRMSFRVDSRLK